LTLIAAPFYIELHGISADPEVSGHSIIVERGAATFRIDFSTEPGSFEYMTMSSAATGHAVDPRDYNPSSAVMVPGGSLVEIRIIRVLVNVESTLSVETFDRESEQDHSEYHELLDSMKAAALQLAAELCDQLRLEVGQHWIEPRGTYPRVVNMVALIDVRTRLDFGVLHGGWGTLRILAPETVLDASSLVRVKAKLQEGSPHAGELLLAEATYLAGEESGVGPDRATLLAAIAVELRTKRALREVASDEQSEMLALLVENPRDWSMAAQGLFRKALPIVCRVPPTPEHRSIAKRVQALFEARNKIAHTGKSLDIVDAAQHIASARDAFVLIQGLVDGVVAAAAEPQAAPAGDAGPFT
jgi:hypothetical protein